MAIADRKRVGKEPGLLTAGLQLFVELDSRLGAAGSRRLSSKGSGADPTPRAALDA